MAELSAVYRIGNDKVEIMPYFLYEVSVYKITRNRASLMDSQYYKSNKALELKDTIKKYPNYSIIKYIRMLGATRDFIEENNLPIYETIKKKKNERTR